MLRFVAVTIASGFIALQHTSADTYTVPGDYATIQQAWDAIPGSGGPGWFIQVSPGFYTENLDLSGKTCWVIGLGESGDVVIDGNSNGSTVTVTNSPFDGGAFLENLDIINGTGFVSGFFSYGGGVYIGAGGRATIDNCWVYDNLAIYGGGVFVADGSSLVTYDSSFLLNQGLLGGCICSLGWGTIHNCNFTDNRSNQGGHLFLYANSESTTITDSDFTFGESLHNGTDGQSGGGAIAVLNSGAVTVRRSSLILNTADERGGAIWVDDPANIGGDRTLTITDCDISYNDADIAGGGVYFTDTGSLYVSETSFTENQSSYGGSGCWLSEGSFTFEDGCSFSGQTMTDVGTGFRNGGGIFAISCEELTISDTTFNDNRAVYYGGALYLNSSPTTLNNVTMTANDSESWGDAIYAVHGNYKYGNTLDMTGCSIEDHPDDCAVYVRMVVFNATGCTFSNNNSTYLNGGALWLSNDSNEIPAQIQSCVFNDNSSGDRGAAIHLDDMNADIHNCTFSRNTVDGPNDYRGGAIFAEDGSILNVSNCSFTDNYCDGDGGAIALMSTSDLTLSNSQFTDNQATDEGAAIHIGSSASSASIDSSVFTGNNTTGIGGGLFNHASGTAVTDCEFTGNTATGGGGGVRAQMWTTIADSTICGNLPDQASGNWSDNGGNTIGAICGDCPADLDSSGTVDGADLATLLGAWGACSGCSADLDDSGTVDGADLAALLGAWGKCPK